MEKFTESFISTGVTRERVSKLIHKSVKIIYFYEQTGTEEERRKWKKNRTLKTFGITADNLAFLSLDSQERKYI